MGYITTERTIPDNRASASQAPPGLWTPPPKKKEKKRKKTQRNLCPLRRTPTIPGEVGGLRGLLVPRPYGGTVGGW